MDLEETQSINERLTLGQQIEEEAVQRLKEAALYGESPVWAYAAGALLRIGGNENLVEQLLKQRLAGPSLKGLDSFAISEYLDRALDNLNNEFLITWMADTLKSKSDAFCQINIAATVAARANAGAVWAIKLREIHRNTHPVPIVRKNLEAN